MEREKTEKVNEFESLGQREGHPTDEPQQPQEEGHGGYRSLFWPLLLIGVGALWLLMNLGVIPQISWAALGQLWPLLLVAIGLDIIFGRQSALLGALIGLLLLGGVVGMLALNPNWTAEGRSAGLQTTETTVSLNNNVESAEVRLDLDVYDTTVRALPPGAGSLLEAVLEHHGEIIIEEDGGRGQFVSIDHRMPGFISIGGPFDNGEWLIELNPDVPTALTVDSGVGNTEFDLSDIQLTDFNFDGDVGNTQIDLPVSTTRYFADIDMGVGNNQITIADEAELDMEIDGDVGNITVTFGSAVDAELDVDGGVGNVTISVPEGSAVRLIADDGSGIGDLSFPGEWVEVDGGIYETVGFEGAPRQIVILIDDLDIGDITITQ